MVRAMRQAYEGTNGLGMARKKSSLFLLEELKVEHHQGKAGFRRGEGRKLVGVLASSLQPGLLSRTPWALQNGTGLTEVERQVSPQTPQAPSWGCDAPLDFSSGFWILALIHCVEGERNKKGERGAKRTEKGPGRETWMKTGEARRYS